MDEFSELLEDESLVFYVVSFCCLLFWVEEYLGLSGSLFLILYCFCSQIQIKKYYKRKTNFLRKKLILPQGKKKILKYLVIVFLIFFQKIRENIKYRRGICNIKKVDLLVQWVRMRNDSTKYIIG